MKKIVYLLTNRFTLYLAISGIITLAIIFNIDKYKAELISTVVSSKFFSYYYNDLDNDGNSEKMEYIMKPYDRHGIIVYTNGKTIGQWSFLGEWANTSSPFIADYDNDGIKEIFVFTVFNDSIFFHCLDAINKKIEIENKAVCKAFKDNGVYDFTIIPCTAYDVNSDGYKEIFFSIVTGYSTSPRNMFAYYPKKDSILVSPESCSSIVFPQMLDLDGDSAPEFMGSITHATGNCKPERKYTDQYSWLMVFTPEMKFKFPPVQFSAHPAISRFSPYSIGKKIYILAFHYYEGTENFPSFIALFDSNGKIIRKKNFDSSENLYYSPIFSRSAEYKEVFILLRNGEVMRIDSMLNMQYETKFENKVNT